MSSSLQPHGLQKTRPPYPSLSPRACSNSCPLSQWCHPTISSSVVPFSSCLQSFPASGSFLTIEIEIETEPSIYPKEIKSLSWSNICHPPMFISLPTKVCLVKAMVFPVVMYGCESWTIKKAEPWKIDAFELWCWRRLLRAPWTARSNQSILKEINPEYSLEGLMLKLKFQYFGHLMRRADSLEKTLMLGKTEGRRRRGWQEVEMVGWNHQLNGHEFEQARGDSEGQGSLGCCSPWGCKESDTTERLNNNNSEN